MAGITHYKQKNWKVECPKYHHIEASEADGYKCNNCGAPAAMTYPAGDFVDEKARLSWRQLICTNDCGWTANQMICSKCETNINGAWFKSDGLKWCFVATAAFDDQDHPTVEQLRRIRDERFSQNRVGRRFVKFYYAYGPRLARVVDQFPSTKPALRAVLTALGKVLTK